MAEREPWLSVIMPTYNGAEYLTAALESVYREGSEDVEVIAVDDGSTDATVDILRAHQTQLVLRIVWRGRVGNWVAGTNHGLREARGRYACILHQDDLWLPGRLRAVRGALAARPEISLLVHDAIFIGPTGGRLAAWRCPLRSGAVEPRLFTERLLVQNFIAIPSPVFDRQLALRLNGLDESLWYTADWDFWLRVGGSGRVSHLGETLAAFRVHPASQTMVRPRSREEFRQQMRAVFEPHFAKWCEGEASAKRRREVRLAAQFSIEMNAALASASRGETVVWKDLASRLLRLGPTGWRRYWRDSRIAERVVSRLRVGASLRSGGRV